MNFLDKRLAKRIPRVTTSVVYHYCSGQTLLSILANKTIRACDLDKMNDYLEYEWGLGILKDALKLSEEKTSSDFTKFIEHHVHDARARMVPLVACFSENGDVLSQWRAYAGDGDGFSVGFNTKSIRQFPGNLFQVVYDRGEQLQLMRDHLESEFSRWSKFSDADKYDEIERIGGVLAADICLFKNSSFSEEKEVRLVYLLTTDIDDDDQNAVLTDPRSYDDDDDESPKLLPTNISYLCRNGLIVPYCDFTTDADPDDAESLISNVYIGPRNRSSERDVQHLLSSSGFLHAKPIKSRSSYR